MTAEASRWQHDAAEPDETGQEAIALFELAEQLGHFGHWRVSLPEHAITWSKTVYEIHCVNRDSYTPEIDTADGFYHPDDRDAFRNAVTTAAHGDPPFKLSVRLMRAGVTFRYLECRGLAIPSPDGPPTAVFGVFIDVSEQREANLKLEQIAYGDALTGLANRRQFDDVLRREWTRAVRERTPLSLILMDVDRFKNFNDLYGHLAGDECLRVVGGALAASIYRPADVAARYGGEEFALILPATKPKGAETVAHKLRAAVAALGITHAGNLSCGGSVTASIGVCTAFPQVGGPPEAWLALIAEADALLYEAKRTGRNKVASKADAGGCLIAPMAANEEERLATLAVYEQAGVARRTAELDRIAKLAAVLTSSPIGLLSVITKKEQQFIGNYGLEGVEATPREFSFCGHTILGDAPLVVLDATRDSRFEANPFVTGALSARYYAGAPVVSETTGHRLGSLCVIDRTAHAEMSPAQRAMLTDLAKMAAILLEDKLGASKGLAHDRLLAATESPL